MHAHLRAQVLDLHSMNHNAAITYGFSDDSFKTLTPVQKQNQFDRAKAYVEFSSRTFLAGHFVLVWAVPRVDLGRCLVEQYSEAKHGEQPTFAYAMTFVSNVTLDPAEHGTYLFYEPYKQ